MLSSAALYMYCSTPFAQSVEGPEFEPALVPSCSSITNVVLLQY